MTLPRVSIWSQFRNSAGQQIELYRNQINNLDYPPDLLKIYLNEGDSDDGTLAELQAWAVEDDRITVINHDTGIAHHAHSTRPERMQAVSRCGNVAWDRIAQDGWGEFAWMIESDLLIQSDLLRRMIERRPVEADIFSPMIWITVNGGIRFYDIWAYRKNGEMFRPAPPAWYARFGSDPFEVDSVGSVVLFEMDLIRVGLRLSEETCVLGMCNQARQMGARIFVDPELHVLHPIIEGIS